MLNERLQKIKNKNLSIKSPEADEAQIDPPNIEKSIVETHDCNSPADLSARSPSHIATSMTERINNVGQEKFAEFDKSPNGQKERDYTKSKSSVGLKDKKQNESQIYESPMEEEEVNLFNELQEEADGVFCKSKLASTTTQKKQGN